jgi:hypothetical protein
MGLSSVVWRDVQASLGSPADGASTKYFDGFTTCPPDG